MVAARQTSCAARSAADALSKRTCTLCSLLLPATAPLQQPRPSGCTAACSVSSSSWAEAPISWSSSSTRPSPQCTTGGAMRNPRSSSRPSEEASAIVSREESKSEAQRGGGGWRGAKTSGAEREATSSDGERGQRDGEKEGSEEAERGKRGKEERTEG
eukprot:scaffold289799_cov28-Tisochrysis_lutea.AAC.2